MNMENIKTFVFRDSPFEMSYYEYYSLCEKAYGTMIEMEMCVVGWKNGEEHFVDVMVVSEKEKDMYLSSKGCRVLSRWEIMNDCGAHEELLIFGLRRVWETK